MSVRSELATPPPRSDGHETTGAPIGGLALGRHAASKPRGGQAGNRANDVLAWRSRIVGHVEEARPGEICYDPFRAEAVGVPELAVQGSRRGGSMTIPNTEVPAIVAALIRDAEGRLLLVEQRGPEDPEPTWMLPAGRIEPGESATEALIREVREETGLIVEGEPVLLFTARYAMPAIGPWVAVTYGCEAAGNLQPDDPDGYILAAAWFMPADALLRLGRVTWYDAEPLSRWLSGEAPAGSQYEPRSAQDRD